MTTLLKKAFKEASRLPDIKQNIFAKWVLDELIAEKKWEKIFAQSETNLELFADLAVEEHKSKKTKMLQKS